MKVLAALIIPLSPFITAASFTVYWVETPGTLSSSYEEFSHTVEQKEKL